MNNDSFKNFDSPAVIWSLAVSNEITSPDQTNDVLIAVSCFDDDINNDNVEDNEVDAYLNLQISKNVILLTGGRITQKDFLY